MPSLPPIAKHRAVRALAEGAEATLELLADASGTPLRTLRRRAESEVWALDRAPRDDVAARLREMAALLLDRVEALGRTAMEPGGRIDKAEIEGIITIIRGLDKIGEIMRPQEAAKENQIRQDEDLADTLDHINHRIVELAHAFAGQMEPGACRDRRGEKAPG